MVHGTTTSGLLVRVGLIGDVHAEDAALALALRALGEQGVDAVLCAGDIADGSGSVDRCCALLRDAGAHAVRGNHERWLLDGTMRALRDATDPAALAPATLAYLAALPATRTLATAAGPLLLCHGLGERDMVRFRPDDFGYDLANNDALHALCAAGAHAFVVGGHTHERMVRRYRGLTVINAGTLARGDAPCFAVVDFAAREAVFYDLDPARGAARPAERCALPGRDGLALARGREAHYPPG